MITMYMFKRERGKESVTFRVLLRKREVVGPRKPWSWEGVYCTRGSLTFGTLIPFSHQSKLQRWQQGKKGERF